MAYQTLRGFYDILPGETKKWQKMESLIHTVCSLYGYNEIRTPIMEDLKVFKRDNDSSDMVNKEMYAFSMGSDNYCLRPEGTAGVIRSFVENKFYGSMELPAKFYYMGEMFRHERPQKGRQRQFTQFGVENIGVKSPEIDAETIALGINIIKSLGIQSYKVLINTLGDDASRSAYREALKTHFKDHLDELCGDCHRRYEQNPLRILDCKVDHDNPIVQSAPQLSDYLNDESKEYFQRVLNALDALGIPYEIDNRLVRGLDYYTHTVFEVVSTRKDSGAQATVFAGGRYDHLVEYFGGPELSGMGFAIGLERLLMLASEEGYEFTLPKELDAYVISLGNVGSTPLVIANKLRDKGYKCEVNMTARSLKAQFKSADRNKAKYIIILGEDELKEGVVNLKNTATREQVTVSIDDIEKQIESWNA